MRKFFITIGRVRQAPRISMEVMAPDAATAHNQAFDLRESVDERVVVTPVPDEGELQAADIAYLLNQQARERRRLSECTQWEIACERMQGVAS